MRARKKGETDIGLGSDVQNRMTGVEEETGC